jgi:hypothetical protein
VSDMAIAVFPTYELSSCSLNYYSNLKSKDTNLLHFILQIPAARDEKEVFESPPKRDSESAILRRTLARRHILVHKILNKISHIVEKCYLSKEGFCERYKYLVVVRGQYFQWSSLKKLRHDSRGSAYACS